MIVTEAEERESRVCQIATLSLAGRRVRAVREIYSAAFLRDTDSVRGPLSP